MSEQRPAGNEHRAGADVESAPVDDAEVVDAEVVEDEVVVDAEVVDEEGDGVHGATAEAGSELPADEPDPLAGVLRERDEYLALAQRARADFENFKRRATTQAAEAELRGRTTLARSLLPAIDNLGRALAAAGIDSTAPEASGDGLAKGVALVHAELRSALERAGVVAFDPAGERFDPNVHEAISTVPATEGEPGTVVETLELGYRADGQVIRPARVVVSG